MRAVSQEKAALRGGFFIVQEVSRDGTGSVKRAFR
jgi:hypothetical protein